MNNQIQQTLEISDPVLGVIMAKTEKQGVTGTLSIDADIDLLRNTVKAAVLKAYASLEKENTIQALTFIVDGLKDEILRAYPGMRLSEIGLAIHKGAMGEYDKIYGLSLSVFVGFIRSYINSQPRLDALRDAKVNPLELETSKKPSDEEISKARVQIVLNAFDFYKNNKFYKDHGNYVFETLARFNALHFSDDQIKSIWKQARKTVFMEVFKPVSGIAARNERKQLIAEIKGNNEHALFYMEAKRIGLNQYFDELIEFDFQLSDILDKLINKGL